MALSSISSTPLVSSAVVLFEVRVARGVLLEVGECAAALAAVLRGCEVEDASPGWATRDEGVIASQV